MTRFSRSERRNSIISSMIKGTVSASDRIAPVQGLHPSERIRHITLCGFSPGISGMSCSTGIRLPPRTTISRSLAKHWHDGDVLQVDILPDVKLRPVGKREDPDAFSFVHTRVVQVPELGALVFRVPLPERIAERIDALLGPGFFLIPPRAAEGCIVAALRQGVEQSPRLQQATAFLGSQTKGVCSVFNGVAVGMDD